MEQLALPELRWIGLHPTDIERLQMPEDAKLPLTQRDHALITTLLQRPEIQANAEIHNQVAIIFDSGTLNKP